MIELDPPRVLVCGSRRWLWRQTPSPTSPTASVPGVLGAANVKPKGHVVSLAGPWRIRLGGGGATPPQAYPMVRAALMSLLPGALVHDVAPLAQQRLSDGKAQRWWQQRSIEDRRAGGMCRLFRR